MKIGKINTKEYKEIVEIIKREYALTPAERAAALLFAKGIGSPTVMRLVELSDIQRVAVLNELRSFEVNAYKKTVKGG